MVYDPSKLPAFYSDDKSDWAPQTFRASPEHEELIDKAASKVGLKKAHFMLQAVVEKALAVVEETA